jgi:DNA-directed RNA polymerase II subunit RPB1
VQLAAQLETAHVLGVHGIAGAAVEAKGGRWVVYTEGSNLAGVAAIDGVDASKVYSNDVMENHAVLGVEAARAALVRELRAVLEADGSYVNIRHISLLCDVMTHRGDVSAFTRHGLARSDAGFLARCSFEETVEVLYNAATFGDREVVSGRGVTSNILLGQLAPVGTGSFSLALDTSALASAASAASGAKLHHYVPSTPDRGACASSPASELHSASLLSASCASALHSASLHSASLLSASCASALHSASLLSASLLSASPHSASCAHGQYRPSTPDSPRPRPSPSPSPSPFVHGQYRPSTPDAHDGYTPSTPTRPCGYEPSTP